MKVTVDDDRCRGHGMCLTLCPEVFDMTDDGWAVAVPEDVPEGLEAAAREAEEAAAREAQEAAPRAAESREGRS